MRKKVASLVALAFAGVYACDGNGPAQSDAGADVPYQPPPNEPLQTAKVTVSVDSTRFVVREHFLASAEMQISGEPLAETMERDLGGYSRDHLPPDIYFDPSPYAQTPWVDLPG